MDVAWIQFYVVVVSLQCCQFIIDSVLTLGIPVCHFYTFPLFCVYEKVIIYFAYQPVWVVFISMEGYQIQTSRFQLSSVTRRQFIMLSVAPSKSNKTYFHSSHFCVWTSFIINRRSTSTGEEMLHSFVWHLPLILCIASLSGV